MDKILELFECQIGDTTNAFPSIFSKDDVVSLLIKLKDNVLAEAAELKAQQDAGVVFNWEQINRAVMDILDDYDFNEFVECEPELHGSYGDSYSLEMNTSFDDHQFTRTFTSDLEDYFKPNNE